MVATSKTELHANWKNRIVTNFINWR